MVSESRGTTRRRILLAMNALVIALCSDGAVAVIHNDDACIESALRTVEKRMGIRFAGPISMSETPDKTPIYEQLNDVDFHIDRQLLDDRGTLDPEKKSEQSEWHATMLHGVLDLKLERTRTVQPTRLRLEFPLGNDWPKPERRIRKAKRIARELERRLESCLGGPIERAAK